MIINLDNYRKSGILQKVVQSIPDWTIGLTVITARDNRQVELDDWMMNIDLLKWAKIAATSARLFGEAYLIMHNDEDNPSDPIIPGTIQYLLLKEKGEIIPKKDDLGRVVFYELQNEDKTNVHPSRVVTFTGIYYTPTMSEEHGSVLEPVENAYLLYEKSNNNIAKVIERFLTFVQKVGNLKSYLTSEFPSVMEYSERMYEALRSLVATIGKGVLLMDKTNSEITALSPNVSGLEGLSKTILENLVANTNIPYSLLMGSGNYALSSAVEYRFFRLRLASYFTDEIQPALRKIITTQGYVASVTIDFQDDTEIKV